MSRRERIRAGRNFNGLSLFWLMFSVLPAHSSCFWGFFSDVPKILTKFKLFNTYFCVKTLLLLQNESFLQTELLLLQEFSLPEHIFNIVNLIFLQALLMPLQRKHITRMLKLFVERAYFFVLLLYTL